MWAHTNTVRSAAPNLAHFISFPSPALLLAIRSLFSGHKKRRRHHRKKRHFMATNTLPESNNHHHPSTPTIPLNLALNSSIDSYSPFQINGGQHTPTPLPTTSIAATDNLEPSHQLQHRERHRRTGGENERVESRNKERGRERTRALEGQISFFRQFEGAPPALERRWDRGPSDPLVFALQSMIVRASTCHHCFSNLSELSLAFTRFILGFRCCWYRSSYYDCDLKKTYFIKNIFNWV